MEDNKIEGMRQGRFDNLRKYLNQHRKKYIALLSIAFTVSAISTIIFAGIVASEIRYGVTLNLNDFGLAEFSHFMSILPWAAIILTLISGIVTVIFTNKVVSKFHKSLYVGSFAPVHSVLAVLVLISALGVLIGSTTSFDNNFALKGQLSALRTFNTFVDDHILAGDLIFIDNNKLVVKDQYGDIWEVDTAGEAREDIGRRRLHRGKRIAAYIKYGDEANRYWRKWRVDEHKVRETIITAESEEVEEPLEVAVSNPIVVDPKFEIPNSKDIDDDASKINIAINARGVTGDEEITLKLDDNSLVVWELDTSFKTYTYEYKGSASVDSFVFAYDNDVFEEGYDRNIKVDYAEFNGVRYEAESPSTYASGHWNGEECAVGYISVDSLQCPGHFIFNSTYAAPIPPAEEPEPTPEPEEPAPQPEPTPTPEPTPSVPPSGNTGIARCEALYGRYNGTKRDYVRCPFSENSPINTPIPAGASFVNDARTSELRRSTSYAMNTSSWTIAIFDAANASSFVNVNGGYCPRANVAGFSHPCNVQVPSNMTQSPDSDAAAGFFGAEGQYYHEFYAFNRSSASAAVYVRRSLTESGIPRSNTYDGIRAWGGSNLSGLIRKHEIAKEITHPVAIGIKTEQLKKGWVFPAGSEDSFSDSYGGNIPMGTRFGIPPNVNVETMPISSAAKVLARAMQTYGAYVFDQSGTPGQPSVVFFAELGANNPGISSNDMRTIIASTSALNWCNPTLCSW